MNPARNNRVYWVAGLVCGVSAAAALALAALKETIHRYYTPSQIVAGEAPRGARIRAGGLVEAGSLKRVPGSLALRFKLSDGDRSIIVLYQGILPDLFREGQGIVALGSLERDGMLHAEEVLAKHDENYMPPEAEHALRNNGAAGRPLRDNKEFPR